MNRQHRFKSLRSTKNDDYSHLNQLGYRSLQDNIKQGLKRKINDS